ncbi:hypothetical protein ACVWXU_000162 [Streptomyces sp. TE33382]
MEQLLGGPERGGGVLRPVPAVRRLLKTSVLKDAIAVTT